MSNQSVHPALLEPPFFLVPGILPSSAVSAQTEQLDQLNTLLLQEIDANFAKFHQIVTSRILPSVKRFAIAGEPTCEAARFWKSFFEAASAVKAPHAHGEGESTLNVTEDDAEGHTEYEDQTLRMRRVGEDGEEESYVDSGVGEEGSFMFDNGPTSSTPMANRNTGGYGDDSWENSIGSPFDSLDRRLMTDLKIGQGYAASDAPTPSLPSGYELPSLNSGYSHEEASTGTVDPSDLGSNANDTPKASKRNPFASTATYNGITDLRSTPLNAKFKQPKKPTTTNSSRNLATTLADLSVLSDDEDLDNHYKMSPPVTMNFTLPSRAKEMIKVANQTPKKGSSSGTKTVDAHVVIDDIMEEMMSGYVPSPRLPTPEGLGRYSIMPGDLPASNLHYSGDNDSPLRRKSMANTSFGSDMSPTISQPIPTQNQIYEDDSFDEDSFDSIPDQQIAPPSSSSYHSNSTHSATHSHHPHPDDSMNSESNDSLDSENGEAERERIAKATEASIIFGGPKGASKAGFSLLRPDEIDTFFGGRLEDAGGVESPTPVYR